MQKATKVLKMTLERLYEQLHQDLFSSYTSSSSELWLDTTPVDHDSKAWKKKVELICMLYRSSLITVVFFMLIIFQYCQVSGFSVWLIGCVSELSFIYHSAQWLILT